MAVREKAVRNPDFTPPRVGWASVARSPFPPVVKFLVLALF